MIDRECTHHRIITINIQSGDERNEEAEAGGVDDDEVVNEGARLHGSWHQGRYHQHLVRCGY